MYQKVYFYIEGVYQPGIGFSSEQAGEAFHTEVKDIFSKGDWEVRQGELSGSSPSAYKGEQELYLHPMMFSGVILKSEVPLVEAMLNTAQTFRLRNIGRFEEYEDMSDADYNAYLITKQADIVRDLLDAYRTERRDCYITDDYTKSVGKRYKINRIASKNSYGDLAYLYSFHLRQALVEMGYILKNHTRRGVGYRTANEAEQMRLRKLFDVNGDLQSWWFDAIDSQADMPLLPLASGADMLRSAT